MGQMTGCVLVVLSHHYINFEDKGVDEEGDRFFDVWDEETGSPRLVGVYTTPSQAASACFSFIQEFDPAEDDSHGGPIESVSIYASKVDSITLEKGVWLATLSLTGDKDALEKQIQEAYKKHWDERFSPSMGALSPP